MNRGKTDVVLNMGNVNITTTNINQNSDNIINNFIFSFILNIQNISKVFESATGSVTSLWQISYNVKKGEFVSILGLSSSGKSTLLTILVGIDKTIFCKSKMDNSKRRLLIKWS